MASPPPLAPKPAIKLFVKAGCDGASYGACPISQRIYMILALKSAVGGYPFTVYAINLAKATAEFTALGLRHVPAISYLQDHLDNVDEILEFLDDNFPKCDLSYDNILAEKACKDVFSKFCFFIKSVSKDAYGLTLELEKVDKYLAARKGRFLCGDTMTYLDCELLPKLQQIRVAGRDLKGFYLPATLTALWSYLKAAYATEVFRTTCPSDEEITLHWMERTETALTLPKPQRRKSALINPAQHQFSFDTPLDAPFSCDTPPDAKSQEISGPGTTAPANGTSKDAVPEMAQTDSETPDVGALNRDELAVSVPVPLSVPILPGIEPLKAHL